MGDKGYFRIGDIEACEKAGLDPYVRRPQRGRSVRASIVRKDEFSDDRAGDSFLCPADRRLHPHSSSLFASVEEDQLRPQASPRRPAPRHPQPAPRDGRAPIWLNQAMDGPGDVSGAWPEEGPCRAAQADSDACNQFRGTLGGAIRRADSARPQIALPVRGRSVGTFPDRSRNIVPRRSRRSLGASSGEEP